MSKFDSLVPLGLMLIVLPAFAGEVAKIALLLPVANESAMAGFASEFVECCVHHVCLLESLPCYFSLKSSNYSRY